MVGKELINKNQYEVTYPVSVAETSESADDDAATSPANGDVKKFITENGNLNNNSIDDDAMIKEGNAFMNKKASPGKRKRKNDSANPDMKAAKSNSIESDKAMNGNSNTTLDRSLDYHRLVLMYAYGRNNYFVIDYI